MFGCIADDNEEEHRAQVEGLIWWIDNNHFQLAGSGVKHKLMTKASFVVGAELDTLDVVVERRMSRKSSQRIPLSLDPNWDFLLWSPLIGYNLMIS